MTQPLVAMFTIIGFLGGFFLGQLVSRRTHAQMLEEIIEHRAKERLLKRARIEARESTERQINHEVERRMQETGNGSQG